MFRFVNSLALLDQDSVWKSFRKDRADYFKENIKKECYGLLSKADIELNQKKLEKNFLVFNISDERNSSISNQQINIGGQMFMMLNTCPDFYKKIYHMAFYGPQSRLGELSLNIFKKSTDEFKAKAKRILAKVSSALRFKYIQHTEENGKIKFTKNINSVEGSSDLLITIITTLQ